MMPENPASNECNDDLSTHTHLPTEGHVIGHVIWLCSSWRGGPEARYSSAVTKGQLFHQHAQLAQKLFQVGDISLKVMFRESDDFWKGEEDVSRLEV